MLTIKVLGPGCANCYAMERHTRMALEQLQPAVAYEISKISDPLAISEYILHTPGLVINEKVVCEGRVPKTEEVVTWLVDALETT